MSETNKRIRYGILGFGAHAIRRIIPASIAAEHYVLAGLWRRDAAQAAANAAEFGIPYNFATAEELCASPEIDAVFIISPDVLHREHTLLALRHGKPVLCEKPVAMNAAEATEMQAAAEKAGLLYAVAQNFRFNRTVEIMRDWIRAGRIGKPQLAAAEYCYPANKSPRKWIADPTIACGGPIADVGVHCIDALRYILSEEVLSISTIAHKEKETDAVEAIAHMQLAFSNNVYASVTANARGLYRTYLEVVGETGVIIAENGLSVDRDLEVTLRSNGDLIETITTHNKDGYTRMLNSFALALMGKATYPATGADGILNMRAIDAAYRSWHTGKREAI